MANIGTFIKTEQGFTGELVTLSLKAKNVRLVEEAASSNENAPTHRVFVGSGDRSRLGEALQRGPPIPLSQARRPELHGSHLREPGRGRGRQDPHADLVPRPQAHRRLISRHAMPRREAALSTALRYSERDDLRISPQLRGVRARRL
jgi:Protein of unknown function (DUF736)